MQKVTEFHFFEELKLGFEFSFIDDEIEIEDVLSTGLNDILSVEIYPYLIINNSQKESILGKYREYCMIRLQGIINKYPMLYINFDIDYENILVTEKRTINVGIKMIGLNPTVKIKA